MSTSLVDIRPIPRRRRRRRRRLLLLLLFGLSMVPSVVTSFIAVSLFADHALRSDNAWAPAAIDVDVFPARLPDVVGMLPGDSSRSELLIANPGAMPLRYTLMVTASDNDGSGLRSALVADLRNGTCSEDGELLYRGPLADARVGDPAAGAQPGDRRLPPTGDERLCLEVRLPADASNAYASAGTAIAVTVLAEQGAVE